MRRCLTSSSSERSSLNVNDSSTSLRGMETTLDINPSSLLLGRIGRSPKTTLAAKKHHLKNSRIISSTRLNQITAFERHFQRTPSTPPTDPIAVPIKPASDNEKYPKLIKQMANLSLAIQTLQNKGTEAPAPRSATLACHLLSTSSQRFCGLPHPHFHRLLLWLQPNPPGPTISRVHCFRHSFGISETDTITTGMDESGRLFSTDHL